MGDRKKILFLINSLTGGGAERVMCTLLRHSREEADQFDITLALLDVEPAAYQPPEWIRVRQLDCRKSMARTLREVGALMMELRPEVTVSFLMRANAANAALSRLRGAGAVISARTNASAHFKHNERSPMSAAMLRATYPLADRAICVSDGVAADLRQNFGVRANNLVVIPNPIDVAAIREKAAERPAIEIDGPYIMAAGRLIEAKNFAMLIDAFAASSFPGKLVITGEGPAREALTAQIARLGLAGRVLLPGFAANPYALMKRAELFVLSSNAEGFPNALVEAMAVGAPVIAANCASGPSEILAEAERESIQALTFAEHGVVTPPNDAASLTTAIEAMAEPARRAQYAAKAERRAAEYDAQTAKNRYWAVVRGLLRTPVRTPSPALAGMF